MASILVVSKEGDGVPLALRLAQEGHICKMHIKDSRAKHSLKGYKNPQVLSKLQMVEQFDLVLFDMVGLGDLAEKLKSEGRTVLGGGAINDKLELDRAYGSKVCSTLTKLTIPPTIQVETKEDLLKALEDDKPKVIKPDNNKSTTLTLVGGKNNDTLRTIVNKFDDLCPCIIQDKIDGVEVSTEGWFNGREFTAFNHTIEYKRLMEDDHGPQTGCMGNIVWSCGEDELVKQALLPLTALLRKTDYIGPIDVNCIVNEDKAYFLEYTARFGYDAIQAYTELVRGGLFEFLWSVATQGPMPRFSEDYAIAVRMSMPPYPTKVGAEKNEGVKVLDVTEGAKNHLYLADVQMNENEEVLAGIDGVIGCATARGRTIKEVQKRALRTVREAVIHPDVQYRTDIGRNVDERIATLKTWEWLDA